ncbi:MAG: adenylate/guanylate cyclase domain-containing protein [Polyangia bacterium]|jgi:adenylate cyclase|nr:adenylate/guanylate cyclase domain-containing protein [Polyangia bacterium]
MRFRTKVLLLLVGTTVLTNAASIWLVYAQCRPLLYDEIRSKVLSIAATTAAFVDGDEHERVRVRSDESSPAYARLEERLRRARDANRRADVFVKFIYTLRIDPTNPARYVFGIDAEEGGEDKSHVGDVYTMKNQAERPSVSRLEVDREFTEDKWGKWLSAVAPIKDSEGRPVAALGVDVKASEVVKKLDRVLLSALLGIFVALALAMVAGIWIARRVSRPLDTLSGCLTAIGKGQLEVEVPLRGKDEFGQIGRDVEAMTKGLREREMLKTGFARYVSKDVVDSLLARGVQPDVHGERREVTILFSDIRNFTSLSERLRPEQVVVLLNEYFERMIEVVFRNQGTLDKFIGDGLMVLFGCPLEDPDHAVHAAEAALEMQAELADLRDRWRREGLPEIEIGVGIHTGPAIVGNIGSSKRLEYTAIGDTVNLASRIESATKEMKRSILLSGSTQAAVAERYSTEPLGEIRVKGRDAPVTVFALRGRKDELAPGAGDATARVI